MHCAAEIDVIGTDLRIEFSTFSNVTVVLPENVPRKSIYRQSVQAVRISQSHLNSGANTFRLALNLSVIDEINFGDYMTTSINYNATSDELAERLQALPHVGRVSVVKNEILTL